MRDIRSGVSEQELQEKYKIAPHRVEKLFKRIVAAGAVGESELAQRFPAHKAAIFSIDQSRERRAVLGVELIAYDIATSSTGLVRDISKTGLRMAGINCRVDEERTFQVPMEPLMQVDPLLIVAKCRWTKARGKTIKYFTAGFEITHRSERDGLVLKMLVDSMSAPRLSHSSGHALGKKAVFQSITLDQYGAGDPKDARPCAVAAEAEPWPPSWFDREAIKALQDIYRSGTLKEILAWWEARKTGLPPRRLVEILS